MEKYLLTAQPEAIRHALSEAGMPKVLSTPAPGIVLVEGFQRPLSPIFLRHVCPVQAEVRLSFELKDLGALGASMKTLLPQLDSKKTFSVQTRILEGSMPAYKPFDVNSSLSGICERAGLTLDVKTPQQIVSVAVTSVGAYLGVSTPEENLSAWAGGCRRFRKEPEQVSRAEFKLLEAIEVFGLQLPQEGTGLDLGAAPGGWTRVLRQKGLKVIAVDPALLDPRVAADPGVTHFRDLAQKYFENPTLCDIMVNDMRMDCMLSARLMNEGAKTLVPHGLGVLTLKLTEDANEWPRRVRQACNILGDEYEILGTRQLFHNRNEVTVALRRK